MPTAVEKCPSLKHQTLRDSQLCETTPPACVTCHGVTAAYLLRTMTPRPSGKPWPEAQLRTCIVAETGGCLRPVLGSPVYAVSCSRGHAVLYAASTPPDKAGCGTGRVLRCYRQRGLEMRVCYRADPSVRIYSTISLLTTRVRRDNDLPSCCGRYTASTALPFGSECEGGPCEACGPGSRQRPQVFLDPVFPPSTSDIPRLGPRNHCRPDLDTRRRCPTSSDAFCRISQCLQPGTRDN